MEESRRNDKEPKKKNQQCISTGATSSLNAKKRRTERNAPFRIRFLPGYIKHQISRERNDLLPDKLEQRVEGRVAEIVLL